MLHSVTLHRRLSDIANERLPHFEPADETFPVIPAPSMRRIEGSSVEELIRRALEEDEEGEKGVVERIADRIASGRMPTGRPTPLKRFETT